MNKFCPKCGCDHTKDGTFCSRSCANSRRWSKSDKEKKRQSALNSDKVKLSNQKFGLLRGQQSAATKCGLTLEEWKKQYVPRIQHNGCKHCKVHMVGLKTICDDCRVSYYRYYRPSCEFKFNISDYPSWFDTSELKRVGMYSPTNRNNNLGGVSRDHMLSVAEAFGLGLDPIMVKHPANCRLILHRENQRKRSNSIITEKELLERIELFDALMVKPG